MADLLITRDGETIRLLSPDVGLFTEPVPVGASIAPGQHVGSLLALGRTIELVAPEGAEGRVSSAPRERVRAPVGFGDVLYEIAPLAAAPRAASTSTAVRAEASAGSGSLVLRSPQTGRFYHQPSPGDPAFVAAGSIVEDGRPVGLIEVMKTFSHVLYVSSGGLSSGGSASAALPKRARIVRMLAADGADVKQGAPLLEVEPA